jgi:hypothetical protein
VTASRTIIDRGHVRSAVAYCLRPTHLRRTLTIALVVGTLLTLVNLSDVLLSGQATGATGLKAGANYVIPFLVSNLGLLSGKPAMEAHDAAADTDSLG